MSFNMWQEEPSDKVLGLSGTPDAGEDYGLSRIQLNAKYPRPLIAFDRDGVMFETDGSPITSIENAVPIKSSFIAVNILRRKGFKVAMIHDQPGISAKLITHEQVEEIDQYTLKLLGEAGCPSIDGILYNESNNKQDFFAKPKPGMLRRLRDEFNVPYKSGYYVGDKVIDAKMAMKCGLLPVLVCTESEDLSKLNSFANKALKNRTLIYDTFLEFAQKLV
jgi:HAD superfamily hydrolase (TIGR01662 family)|tara:strand:- start:769 stop:1428 length:660 start_codon:yes stop_codon:yes gene_type:complete